MQELGLQREKLTMKMPGAWRTPSADQRPTGEEAQWGFKWAAPSCTTPPLLWQAVSPGFSCGGSLLRVGVPAKSTLRKEESSFSPHSCMGSGSRCLGLSPTSAAYLLCFELQTNRQNGLGAVLVMRHSQLLAGFTPQGVPLWYVECLN